MSASGQKISFSQSGEDLICKFVLDVLGVHQVRYLDIGTHDPIIINNTYLFYKLGGRGVCVEADPDLVSNIKKARPDDTVIHAAVATQSAGPRDFYLMSESTLNTMSAAEANRLVDSEGCSIREKIEVQTIGINELIKENFNPPQIDFLSIDVEGQDLEIIKQIDFSISRPIVVCAETLNYSRNGTQIKIKEIIDFMINNNYFVYGDTYINTIFVDRSRWNVR
jgi:FkbM family methyltransferase